MQFDTENIPQKGGTETKKRRWAELGKWAVSCLPESHKFLLLRAALVPKIPPDWLNGGFQSCLDQWGSKDRGPSMWSQPVYLAAAGSVLAAWNKPHWPHKYSKNNKSKLQVLDTVCWLWWINHSWTSFFWCFETSLNANVNQSTKTSVM